MKIRVRFDGMNSGAIIKKKVKFESENLGLQRVTEWRDAGPDNERYREIVVDYRVIEKVKREEDNAISS